MTVRAARKLLGLREASDADAIRSAYRRLALTAHPDHGGTSERFVELTAARDCLLGSLLVPTDRERAFCIDARGRIRWYWRRARKR